MGHLQSSVAFLCCVPTAAHGTDHDFKHQLGSLANSTTSLNSSWSIFKMGTILLFMGLLKTRDNIDVLRITWDTLVGTPVLLP